MFQKAAFLAGIALSFGIFATAFSVQSGRERIEVSRAKAQFDCRYTRGLCYATGFDMDADRFPPRIAAYDPQRNYGQLLDAANADQRPKGRRWNHTHYWKPPAYSVS